MKTTSLLIFTIVLFFTTTAMAGIIGTVNISNNNNNISSLGYVSGGGWTNGYGYTGVYSWTANTATATGEGKLVPNWGFCIELPQGTASAWYDVRPISEAPLPSQYGTPMGSTKSNLLYELAGRYWDPSWGTGANKASAEAFSYAVWEIIYENTTPYTLNVTKFGDGSISNNNTNGFMTSDTDPTGITSLANNMLASLNGDKTKFNYGLRAISNDSYQDFLIMVPIPATLLLGLIGLGIGGWKLRKSV
jgi:hypothetical protein